MKTSADVQLVTKKLLWLSQAPNFNFEKDEDEVLALALKRGFITLVTEPVYQINDDYEGE
jgi:hypothetical protein